MKLHDTIDVLIGGYMSKDAAEEDYEAVLAESRRASCKAWRWSPRTSRLFSLSSGQTDHMVREGAHGSGGVGIGARAGSSAASGDHRDRCRVGRGHRGSCFHHKTADKIGEQAGETIPPGAPA